MTERNLSPGKVTLIDLLAVRDNEPVDAAVLDEVASHTEHQRTLAALHQVRAQLRALPDVPLDDVVWQSSTAASRTSRWLQYPLATAASVFFLAIISVTWLWQDTPQQPALQIALQNNDGQQLAALMASSRELEQRLYDNGLGALDRAQATVSGQPQNLNIETTAQRALLFRLADVDAQIAALYDQPSIDAARRLRLWQQRVLILNSLLSLGGIEDDAINVRSL